MEIIIFGLLTVLATHKALAANSRVCWFASHLVGHLSVHHAENFPDYSSNIDYSVAQTKGPSQTCSKTTSYCYALWKEIHHNFSIGEIIIIAQGCWESIGKQDCENSNCVTSGKPPKALNNTNFCCCKGDFCNGNVTHLHKNEEVAAVPNYGNTNTDEPNITFFIILIVFFILLVSFPPIFMLLIRLSVINIKKKSVRTCANSLHLLENGLLYNSKISCDNFKVWELLGQGRYGCVWRCTMGDQELAVKIFESHHRQYFYNELDIYCTPFMVHPSLLSYFGYSERVNSNGKTEYLLFLSLAVNGTLQNYLRSKVLDWSTFCNMALTISKGLAYLHASIKIGEKFKPCINHRDLNTQNILVREDLSCVICDLGFATKTIGPKYYHNGQEQNAEIKSINDVGTLRYMPPEVLEGAVDLRDCETALKQIDVYALGIILWELSTRCSDFYPSGVECAPYQLPFEAQMGHPTFEQMKTLICIHKARPLFPALWHNSSAVKSVKETIEDCWDQDQEARLTALCVEERFIDLSKKYKGQKVKYSSQPLDLSPCVPAYSEKNSYLESNNVLVEGDRDFMSNTSSLLEKPYDYVVSNITETSVSTKSTKFLFNSSTTENSNIGNGNEVRAKANSEISFLQNLNINRLTPKKLNLLKSMSDQRKITWSKFKKMFKGKNTGGRIDHNVTNSLVSHENVMDLTTPITSFSSKFETEVLLNNGKLETKINFSSDNSNSSNSHKDKEVKNDSPNVSSIYCLENQTRKRPTTLPLLKNTEFNNLKSGRRKNYYNLKKNLKHTEKYKLNQKCRKLKDKEKQFYLEGHSTPAIWSSHNCSDFLGDGEKLKDKQSTLKTNKGPHRSSDAISDKRELPEAREINAAKYLKEEGFCSPSQPGSFMSPGNETFVRFNDSLVHFATTKNWRSFLENRKRRNCSSSLSLDDDRIMCGSFNEFTHSNKQDIRRFRNSLNSLQNTRLSNSNQTLENIY